MNPPPLLVRAYRPVRVGLEQVERRLTEEVGSLAEGIPFSLAGKRLRAASVLLAGGASRKLFPELVALAVAVELVHGSSLVHDDIIDTAQTRRAQPSLNAANGNSIAVLVGDLLYLTSIRMVQSTGDAAVLSDILETSRLMVAGELDEEMQTIEERLTEQSYLSILDRKTASLFRFSFSSGAKLAGGDVAHLASAGRAFGMAYQICDDCKDAFGPEGDMSRGKLSLPVIHAASQDDELWERLAGGRADPEWVEARTAMQGGTEYAVDRALAYLSEAREALQECSDSVAETEIESFCDYLREECRRLGSAAVAR